MVIERIYQNIEERRQKGLDMSETKAIVDKVL